MTGWYYAKNTLLKTEDVGPLADAAILQMASSGELVASTLVRHETHTQGQWLPLEMIPAAKKRLDEHAERQKVSRAEKTAAAKTAMVDASKKAGSLVARAATGAVSLMKHKPVELPAEPPPQSVGNAQNAWPPPHDRPSEIIDVTATPVPNTPAVQQHPQTVPCKFCHEPIVATAIKCKHCGEFTDSRFAPQQHVPQQQAAPQAIVVNNVIQQVTTVTAGVSYGRRWSGFVAFFLSAFIPGLGQMYKGELLKGIVIFPIVAAGYAFYLIPGLIFHFFTVLDAATHEP